MSDKKSHGGGCGCLGIILIVFVVLKLLGVEPVDSWSWWTVLIPMWIEIGLVAVVVALAIIIKLFE